MPSRSITVFLLSTAALRACVDMGLLQSALARPRQLYAYGDKADSFEIAAAYTAGIIRNHPIVDGNKRTGFILGVLFLELNGYRFTASEESAAQAILSLAAGTLDESALADWLRANVTFARRPLDFSSIDA